eukprot:TRINITY_DN4457_c0_g1_i1.p1 TRINITY_DN4457_c0_g1~~TRINITY_DN4457_c0_g1_i1.p1  ORF type:complete len:320 (+),score=62.99 TRINITY_DN4457_c0_g1_i1:93-1052(+)
MCAPACDATLSSAASGGSCYEPRALVQEEIFTILFEDRTPVTYQWLTHRCGLSAEEAAVQLQRFVDAYPQHVRATWHCEGVRGGQRVAFLADNAAEAMSQLSEPKRMHCYGLTPVRDLRPPAGGDVDMAADVAGAASSPPRPGRSGRVKRGRGELAEEGSAAAAFVPADWQDAGSVSLTLQRWWQSGEPSLTVPPHLLTDSGQLVREAVHMWCDRQHPGLIDHSTVADRDGRPMSLTLRRITAAEGAPQRRYLRRAGYGTGTPGIQHAMRAEASSPRVGERDGCGMDVDAAADMLSKVSLGGGSRVTAGWGAPGEYCDE